MSLHVKPGKRWDPVEGNVGIRMRRGQGESSDERLSGGAPTWSCHPLRCNKHDVKDVHRRAIITTPQYVGPKRVIHARGCRVGQTISPYQETTRHEWTARQLPRG